MSEFKNAAPVLRVEGLTKHFPVAGGKVVHAVDNVTFTIPKGKTLGLVGESGCGKSTCARTIIRIYEPTAGKVFLNGTDISDMTATASRAEIAAFLSRFMKNVMGK